MRLWAKSLMVLLALMLASAWVVSPALSQEEKKEAMEKVEKSLYERLGGYDAIHAVVADFFGRMIPNEQLGKYFIGLSDSSKKKALQLTVDFVCAATGGPCIYTGRDMVTAHTGLGITESDWDLSVKLFKETLDKFKVPEKERAEVLELVGSLKGQIVGL